jgi:hypothetical protein
MNMTIEKIKGRLVKIEITPVGTMRITIELKPDEFYNEGRIRANNLVRMEWVGKCSW